MKLRSLLLLFVLLTVTSFSFAQESFELDWAIPMQTRTFVNHDQEGNFYHTGEFYGIYDFDPGPEILELDAVSPGYGGFIRKLDPDGNLLWVKELKRTGALHGGFTIIPTMIDIDSEGSVYVIGKYTDDIDFDPGPAEYILSGDSYNPTIFLLKLNSEGDFVWVKDFSPFSAILAGETKFWDFTIDAFDNIYFGGTVSDSVDFDAGVGIAIKSGPSEWNSDAFICKYSSDGDFTWVKTFGGNESDLIYTLDTDSEGNIITAGFFKDTADMDPGPDSLGFIASGTLNSDVFLSKLTPDGDLIWAKQFKSIDEVGIGLETIKQLAIGTTDDIYITGFASGSIIDFDLTAEEYLVDLEDGGGNTFTARYDSDANLKWVTRMDNTSILSIALDKDNSIYANGEFSNTVDFDPGPGTFSVTNEGGLGNVDVFINKLDSAGNYMWTGVMAGDDVNCYAKNLFVDDNYSIYTSGDCQDSVDVEPGADLTNYFNYSEIGHGKYLQKIAQCVLTPVSISIDEDFVLTASPFGATYQWIDCDQFDAPLFGETDSVFVPMENGSYAVIVTMGNCADTTDCIYYQFAEVLESREIEWGMYPNPSEGYIILNLPQDISSGKVQIIDYSGRIVAEFDLLNNSNQLDLSKLSNSVYQVKVILDSGIVLNDNLILK